MKKILAASLGALVAMAMVGCGSGPAPGGGSKDGQITMGFSQVGAESGWRTANTKNIQESAAAAGID